MEWQINGHPVIIWLWYSTLWPRDEPCRQIIQENWLERKLQTPCSFTIGNCSCNCCEVIWGFPHSNQGNPTYQLTRNWHEESAELPWLVKSKQAWEIYAGMMESVETQCRGSYLWRENIYSQHAPQPWYKLLQLQPWLRSFGSLLNCWIPVHSILLARTQYLRTNIHYLFCSLPSKGITTPPMIPTVFDTPTTWYHWV